MIITQNSHTMSFSKRRAIHILIILFKEQIIFLRKFDHLYTPSESIMKKRILYFMNFY